MESYEFSGKTVEDAIKAGLASLGIAREDAEITVIDEGKKKLFGSVPARVEIREKKKLTDGERAVEFLKGLFERLHIEAEPCLADEEEKIEIDLQAESGKGLIGRRGEIIDAVQILAGAVANTGRHEYKRVVVDCGNYREEREETLKRVAEKLAAKAIRLGKKMRLEPMNPYERRIIHSALVDNTEVTTKSEGKEPNRFVVIIPNHLKNVEKKRPVRDDRNQENASRGKKERGNDRGGRKFGEKKPYPKRELPAEDTPQTSGTSIRRESSSGGYKKGGFNGFFGTYLGNSLKSDEETETAEENGTSEEE